MVAMLESTVTLSVLLLLSVGVQGVPISQLIESAIPSPFDIARDIQAQIEHLENQVSRTSGEVWCNHIKVKLNALSSEGKLQFTSGANQTTGDQLVLSRTPFGVASLVDLLPTSHIIESILSNVQIAEVIFQCNPMNLTVISQTIDTSFNLIPGLLQAQNLSVTLAIESLLQPSITFNGFLVLGGERVPLNLAYLQSGFKITTDFGSPTLSIVDIVSELTSLSLPLPTNSFMIADQTFKIAGELKDQDNGVIVIGTTFSSHNQAFVILVRENGAVKSAVAADINNFRLRDLVENVAKQDISSIPYLGSVMLPQLELAASSGPISSDLIRQCFNNTALLKCYDDAIPSGFSAFIKFDFSSAILKVTYNNKTTSFTVVKGSLKVRDLLGRIPGIPSIQLPQGFPNILDISIRDFGFDLTHFFYINADFGNVLNFFNGILPPIQAPSIELSIDSFIGDIIPNINYKIFGGFNIGDIKIPINMDYLPELSVFQIDADLSIPSLSIVDIVRELTSLSLPLPNSFTFADQSFKIAGKFDNLANGVLVIGASFNSHDQAFVVLKRENGAVKSAFAADINSFRLSDLIRNVADQDISSIPYLGSVMLPQLGLAVSSGPISSDLIRQCFNNTALLKCYDDAIPSGFSAFIKFDFSSAILKVTYNNKTTSFTVVKGSLKVRDLLGRIPGIPSIQLPQGFPDILDISIRDFGFDLTHFFYINADLGNILNFFNGILPPIQAPSIELSIDNFIGDIIPNINYKIFGGFNIGDIKIPINMDYLPELSVFQIDADLSIPSLSIVDIVRELTSLSLPLPNSFTFADQSFKIAGKLDNLANGILVIGASFNSHDQAFVVLKRENGVLQTAIAADIGRVRLSDLVQNVAGQDISSIPYFGTLMLPQLGLAASSGPISSDLIHQCFNSTILLNCYGDTIPSGSSGFIRFDFSSIIFGIAYGNKTVSFSTKEGSLRLEDLLSRIATTSIPLPAGLNDILGVSIQDFGFDLQKRSVFIRVQLSRTLQYFDGVIQILNPTLYLEVRQPDSDVVVEAYGDIVIAGTTLSLVIAEDDSSVYYLDASTDQISLQPLLSSFSADFVPEQLQPIVSSLPFLTFGIRDFRMVLPFDGSLSQIFISGKPVIAGYSVIDLSATIYRQASKVFAVLELDLGRPNLANVLGQIAPFASNALESIAILNREVNTNIIVSPGDLSNIRITKDAVRSIAIGQGITIRADIPIPSNCNGDLFCGIVRFLLPANTVLHIDTSIVSTSNFQLVAGITGDIRLADGLAMTQAGLELRVGEDTSIGIIGQIAFQNPRLDFTARIYNSASGITLEMIVSGCWYDAFGLPIIDVCNIQGSIGFGPGTLITEISFGGEIRFGVSSCSQGMPLTAIGYVGLNTVQPQDNYYYASFPNGLTFGSLLRSLCVDTTLIPSPIAETGLQPGFLSSFTASLTGRSLPDVNLYIPPGLQLNGTVNIFGLEATANISASSSEGLYASIALPPLDAGGLLQLFASSSDRNQGPYLIADLRPPHVNVEACGYLAVLGVFVDACMYVTRESMSTSVHGRILNIIEASLTLTSSSVGPFGSRQFQCRGHIDSSEFFMIENPIESVANEAANAASSAIGQAENLVNSYTNELNQASSAFDEAKNALQQVQNSFNQASNEVNRLSNDVNSICSTRHCGHVCVPGCGGCSCSWRGCSCDCSDCRHRIPDAGCEAANKACEALKAPIIGSLNAARDSLNSLTSGLNNARNIYNKAEQTFNDATRKLTDATDSLNTVRDTFQQGARVLDQINVLGGLQNILVIEQISIESPLNLAGLGRYSAVVRARVGGVQQNVNLNVDLHDIAGTLIRPLADRLGIGNLL